MGFALSNMQLTSSAFENSGVIPTRYTGEGEDVSPALSWSDVPAGVRSYAVICHDPDAPLISKQGACGFVHWVLYDIPASITSLAEGFDQYTRGINDFGKQGYGGPMPPSGHGRHQYYFWVLALDLEPALADDLTMVQLLARIEPNVLGMNRLVGSYERH